MSPGPYQDDVSFVCLVLASVVSRIGSIGLAFPLHDVIITKDNTMNTIRIRKQQLFIQNDLYLSSIVNLSIVNCQSHASTCTPASMYYSSATIVNLFLYFE